MFDNHFYHQTNFSPIKISDISESYDINKIFQRVKIIALTIIY